MSTRRNPWRSWGFPCFARARVIILLLLLILATASASALNVSGNIAVDTVWRLQDSPVIVTGDISVVDNAILDIEAGVLVRVAETARLRIVQGAIRATGSASLGIVFESARPNPGPGDWGPLIFEDGTLDVTSALHYVTVRNGRGITIHRAAPTFNHLTLRDNAGPAIAMDLESSPVGVGNGAFGNDLNGILLPSGTISGTTRWGVVGIPYVVQQGTIYVGQPPLTLTPVAAELRIGQSIQYVARLAKPAPPGGVTLDIVSSSPSVTAVPATVTIPAGAVQQAFVATAQGVGSATITISRLELGASSSAITVQPPITLTLSPALLRTAPGQQRPMLLALSEPAPPNLTVQLSTSTPGIADAPAQLAIPQGVSQQTFQVTGIVIGRTTISASASGPYVAANAAVEVRRAFLEFGAIGVLAPGAGRAVSIQLSEPASGLTVALANSNPSILQAPTAVAVPDGASEVSFMVRGLANGASTLSASAPAFESALAQVTVETIALQLDPAFAAPIPTGTSDQFTVRSTRPAPAEGLSVTLSTFPPGVVSLSSTTVVIPGGAIASPAFTVTGGTSGITTLSAESPGVTSDSMTLNVTAPPQLQVDSGPLGVGLQRTIDVRRVRSDGSPYADRDPLLVQLNNDTPAALDAPTLVTIPSGASSARFTLTGRLAASAVLTATAVGYATATATVTVVSPSIEFASLDGTRGVQSARDDFGISLSVPGGGYQIVASDIPVSISIVEANPAGIVEGLYAESNGATVRNTLIVRPGRNYASTASGEPDLLYVGSPTAAGTYRLAATIGSGPESPSEVQTVVGGEIKLAFSDAMGQVGRGLRNESYYITRLIGETPYQGNQPTQVTISVSDPTRIAIPSTIEIPAGVSSVPIPIDGLEETAAAVNVSATASGLTSPSDPLQMSVIKVPLDFYLLSASTQVGSGRNGTYLRWYIDGGSRVPVERPIAIELADVSPPGAVNGLYAAATGPQSLGTLRLPTDGSEAVDDSGFTSLVYVGAPVEAGSYRLRVSVPAMGEWLSDPVTIDPGVPGLAFQSSPVLVGLGLESSGLVLSRQGLSLELPTTVSLQSSDPDVVSVPPTMQFDPGESTLVVPVRGLAQSAAPVTVTARLSSDLTASTELSVVLPAIRFSELAGTRGIGGVRDEFAVQWFVEGSGDPFQSSIDNTVVTISMANSSPPDIVDGIYATPTGATALTELSIPAGKYSSTVNGEPQYAYIGSPQRTGTYRLRASIGTGGQWQSDEQSVVIPALVFQPASLVVGKGMRSRSVRVTRRAGFLTEAPFADITLDVQSSLPSVASVDAQWLLSSGQPSIEIPVDGVGLGATQLSAFAAGHDSNAALNVSVVTPQLELSAIPAYLIVGTPASMRASMKVPGSADPFQILVQSTNLQVTSSVPSVATILGNANIEAGDYQSSDIVIQPLSSGYTDISVSAPGIEARSTGLLPVTQ